MLEISEARSLLETIAKARVAADVDALMGHFDDEATFHIVGFGEPVAGIAAVRKAVGDLVATFEFVEWTLVAIFVEGDAIAARHRLKVRHNPTGNVAETQTAEFLSMRDGKCRSYVQFADTALVASISRPA